MNTFTGSPFTTYFCESILPWSVNTRLPGEHGLADGFRFASVGIGLQHVLYVSYLVPAERVRPHVPDILPLAVRSDDSVFVSVVVLKSKLDGLSYLPGPFLPYDQVNLRTYVVDPRTGGPAVYFFRSAVKSRIVAGLTRLVGLGWEHGRFNIRLISEARAGRVRHTTTGDWHGRLQIEASVALEEDAEKEMDGSADVVKHLTGPLVGYYGTKRFGIWHPPLRPTQAHVESIRFDLLASSGLVDPGRIAEPDSVLAVAESRFRIYLPPTRV